MSRVRNIADNTSVFVDGINTSDIIENTNLYYTDVRARASISENSTQLTYNSSTGVLTYTQGDTDSVSEGSTNLYYTDARADARVALIVDAAPSTLDTLNELAAALGDDANFSTTVTNSIATKLPLAGGTMTGDVLYNDNVKAKFGTNVDLEIYHDGSNSYIHEKGVGNLNIKTNVFRVYNAGGTEIMANFIQNGAAELYNDAIKKFATSATGIDVTGTVTADGLTVDGGTINLDGNYPVNTGNVALGDAALDSLTSGGYNVAIGSSALTANTTGNNNTANGYAALSANTTGSSNVANGYNALYSNTTGYNNVANGYQALYANTTGTNNVATGYQALYANTTGSYNVANGSYALHANTTGTNNVAIGSSALTANTTGGSNTANGREALFSNTTGYNNVANGYAALFSNTTGINNVATGYLALFSNTTGTNNTAVGYQAGLINTGANNLFLGMQAAVNATTGTQNTFVGAFVAGQGGVASQMTTGSKNTILGGYNGNQGGLDIRTSSNNIVLSDGDGNPRVIVNSSGNVGIGTTTPTAKLQIGDDWTIDSLYSSNLYIKHGSLIADGDPRINYTSDIGLIISKNSTNTSGPTEVGLVLHNDDTTAGAFSPMLLFTKRESAPSSFKATMAGIWAKSPTGTGANNSWIDGELHFGTAGNSTLGVVSNMVINKEGYVGIGTTAPYSTLQVGDPEDTTAALLTIASRYNGGGGPVLNFRSGHPSNSSVWDMARILVTDDGSYNGRIHFQTGVSGQQAPTTKMTIKANGYVGIGTDSPTSSLHIRTATNTDSTATGTTLLTLENYVGSDINQQKTFIDFTLLDDNANETPQVRIGAEVGQNFNADTQEKEGSGAFVVYTNNADTAAGDAGASLAERFRVDYTGNVGIGTATPAGPLEINTGTGVLLGNTVVITRPAASDYSAITFRTGSTIDWSIGQNPTGFGIWENGSGASNRFIIKVGGNVGIGEVNPLHPLHVNGTIYSTNNIQLNSTKQVLFGNGNQYIKGTNDTSIEIGTGGTATITATHAGDVEISGALKLSATAVLDNATTTTTTVSQTAIDQWSASTYGGGKIIIEAKAGAERQITELLVTHNGTTASAVEYGAVFTGGRLATYDVDISGGNVRILVVASSTTSTSYKVARTTMFA